MAKFEQKVLQDRFRSENAKEEDIQFYQNHKGVGSMHITEELDQAFQRSVENKDIGFRKMEETRDKGGMKMNAVKSNELEVSFHSSGPDSGSEVSLDSSDIEDFAYKFSRSNKSKIMICISAEDLVDCIASVSPRYRVGIRPQTSLVAAICFKSWSGSR